MPGCCFALHLTALFPGSVTDGSFCLPPPHGLRARGCSASALHPRLAQPQHSWGWGDACHVAAAGELS